jgi:hypothetical protein
MGEVLPDWSTDMVTVSMTSAPPSHRRNLKDDQVFL